MKEEGGMVYVELMKGNEGKTRGGEAWRGRDMHRQRRKSRGELNQGRERKENKAFGFRKREERTKK